MLKVARHAKILEIISEKEIETQEELCAELNARNYVVTQATISRDIRDLHLFKVAGVEKKYRYSYINEDESDVSPKMKSLFRDCVISVNYAQNLVVIKTLTAEYNALVFRAITSAVSARLIAVILLSLSFESMFSFSLYSIASSNSSFSAKRSIFSFKISSASS